MRDGYQLLLWYAASRKTSTGMYFIDQNSCLYSWVLVHDLCYFFDIRIKNSNTCYITSIRDRTNNREHSVRAESKISSSMFPNDFFGSLLILLWPSLQNDDALIPVLGYHLSLKLIANCRHRALLQKKFHSRYRRIYTIATSICKESAGLFGEKQATLTSALIPIV